MAHLKIGLCQKSLNMPLRRSLPELRKLGVAGVELEAMGELAPAQLSQTGRRELRHLLRSYDLELAALACPLRRGLSVPENQEARLDYLRQALSLSWDLGAKIVIIHPGPIPTDAKDPRLLLLDDALSALGRHADRIGATLALETGLESGDVLAKFLGRFAVGGLAANLNPGNLLIHGHDPYAAARALRQRIVHAHAKDARLSSASGGAQEVPLGHGDIDWLQMLATLTEIDYRGYLTIERTPGVNALQEAKAAVEFLQGIIR
jgi:L-ribulose-5-phosphate 3-epimerase